MAWDSRAVRVVSSDVPTPAFYDGDFFVLSNRRGKKLSRVEPKTGNVRWTCTLPRQAKYECSPLAADGKLYMINFDAEVAIVDAAKGELIGKITMDEKKDDPVRSSIVAAHGQLFIRTNRKLFCVGGS